MHLARHDLVSRLLLHKSTNGILVAPGTLQAEFHVVLFREVILEVVRMVVEIVSDDFQASVAVEVGGRSSAGASGHWLAFYGSVEINTASGRLDPFGS